MIVSYRRDGQVESVRADPIYFDTERKQWCAMATDVRRPGWIGPAGSGSTIEEAMLNMVENLLELESERPISRYPDEG